MYSWVTSRALRCCSSWAVSPDGDLWLEESVLSRKDLSRTVIEGGRYYHNCDERRASHAIERANTRQWLDRVCIDPDVADESAPEPKPHISKLFHDKLAPAQRWLASQVGRPWDKVYSEL